jgi:site-specific DNA recombinase
MRVLGVTRLSVDSDESTSIARQHAAIAAWADGHGHTVAGWVEDTDVSGAVEPRARKSFMPWLDRADEWDIIAAWKLDRISRKVSHFSKLLEWCDKESKAIVSVTENVDSSDVRAGRLMLNMMMSFAEHERDTISQRTRSSLAYHRKHGSYAGGTIPFGFRSVKVGNEYRLEHDPANKKVLEKVIDKAIEGDPLTKIATWLNTSGVPTRYNRAWHHSALKNILTNRILLGESVHNGQTVRDESGEPVRRVEPVITESDWGKLQAALDKRSRGRTRTQSPNMLLYVASCATCSDTIYKCEFKGGRPTTFFPYYICYGAKKKLCPQKNVRADKVDALISDIVLGTIGPLEVLRRDFIPAEDNAERLVYVQRLIEELDDDRHAGVETNRERYQRRKGKLAAEEAELLARPARPAGYRMVSTGRTYADVWPGLDVNERRKILMDGEVRVFIGRGDRSAFHAAEAAWANELSPGFSTRVSLDPADTEMPGVHIFLLWGEQLAKRLGDRL